MRYHPDDFLRLIGKVEEEGGAQADGKCVGRKLRLKNEKGMLTEFLTTGCQKEARFLVPYSKPPFPTAAGQGLGPRAPKAVGVALVCAVDDDMGLWPRFKSAIQEG